jgi:hypothetical protein
MAEDIEWHEAEGLPYGGVYRGPQQVAENVFGPITTDLEGFVVTPEKLIASEHRCFTVSALGSLVAESHFAGLTAEPEQLPAA